MDPITETVRVQKEYFFTGATKELDFRLRQLRHLKQAIRENEDKIGAALKKDLNKSRFEAYETEIGIVLQEISNAEKHLAQWIRPQRVRTPFSNMPGRSYIYAEPYGLVLIMSPWNYPFQLTLAPLVGALAAGNCAVVKPSNEAPATAAVMAKLLGECFEPRYVAVVAGGREANQNLLAQKFDYIFFTGGMAAGKAVLEAAARHLTPVSLELGGKSPCIVDETANLAKAALRIAWGKCVNAGQTCVAPDYLLAHRRIKDELVERIRRQITAFWGHDPQTHPDYPKMVNQKHFERICGLIQSGGRIVQGGKANAATRQISLAVLEDVSWDMPIMREEIFGPALPVLVFDDLREVVEKIRERPKPLALYLFTASKENERYVLNNVSFGGGCVNETLMHLATPYLPFGGVGESGMGGYHGKYSFDAFSHQKSILKKSNLFEPRVRYAPYQDKNLKILRKFLK
ncbi:MAG: aldehyde dehydrogenase [Peptococcaceae bacterium]|jgi:aldehyde dehydrogenase (NAD+)|nr:aldehyde dehydrogenase [Peptococcaceae bacterium]